MARDYMCQWANCQEERPDLPITVTYRASALKGDTERPRFCCLEHASLWCAQRDNRNTRLITASPDLLDALQRVWGAYGFDPSIDSSIWQDVVSALDKAGRPVTP